MTAIKTLLNKNIESYVITVERELLLAIMHNMQTLQTNTTRAQKLAEEFLQLYPYSEKETVIAVLQELGKKYPESFDIYIKYANEYYQQKADKSVKKAHNHIAKGEIMPAIKTVKGGNYYVRNI